LVKIGTKLDKLKKLPTTPLDEEIPEQLREPLSIELNHRQTKLKGDLALLLGSPIDAMKYYKEGRQKSSERGDLFWNIGCNEGIISTLLHPDVRSQRIDLPESLQLDKISIFRVIITLIHFSTLVRRNLSN
ncbi:MAG: hypothetical protein EZS28_050448, partial [Streblomastix strix]